jgi:serine/threonine protein phosphatase PrpC
VRQLSALLPARQAELLDSTLGLAPVLTAAFLRADAELLRALQSDQTLSDEEATSGSTATVALLRADRLVVAHCGDSRALLVRKGGAFVELTADHRLAGRGAAATREAARVKRAGGWVADGRVLGVLAVSRSLGDYEFKGGRDALLLEGADKGYWDVGRTSGVVLTEDPVIAVPDVSEVPLLVDEGGPAALDPDFLRKSPLRRARRVTRCTLSPPSLTTLHDAPTLASDRHGRPVGLHLIRACRRLRARRTAPQRA